MKEREIEEAAEIAGAAKELFKAFEDSLAEVMATQRLATREAGEALAEARSTLAKLQQQAKEGSEAMRTMQEELRRNWQMHIAENSKAAGREMARAFGAEMAAGLERRLKELAGQAEMATRRLAWRSTLRWVLGLAIGIPLTILLGLDAYMPRPPDPSIPGLTADQAHDVLSRITPCWPQPDRIGDAHVCVVTDNPPRLTRGPHGEAVAVARAM